MELFNALKRRLPQRSLELYAALSRLRLTRTYTGKLFFVAFIGTHLPLIALLGYVLGATGVASIVRWEILAVALPATLVGVAVTLYALYQLVVPIYVTSRALRAYVDHKTLPDLPIRYRDLAGRLMADVQYTVKHIDELTKTLERTALHDYLTGCYTRRAGAERLRGEIARVKRGEGLFSLAFIDLDNFKAINDEHGHGFGDACLKSLAGTVGSELRQGDWLARWGGDEFVLLLWDVDADAAADIMTRIGDTLRAEPQHTDTEQPVHTQVSVGICQFDGRGDEAALLGCADRALYEAKRDKKGDIVVKTAIED